MLLSLAPALVAFSVVVGTADVDGTATALLSVSLAPVAGARPASAAPAAPAVALCTIEHRRGFVPLGTMIDEQHLALTLARASERDASLVVVDLKSCAVRELLDEVVPTQAPLLIGTRLIAVRQIDVTAAGALFDVVAVDVAPGSRSAAVEVLASRQALWVSPARGARTLAALRFLIADGAESDDGNFHVDRIDDGGFVADVALGHGVFRAPVVVQGKLLVEVDDVDPKKGARGVLRDREGRVQVSGLAGLSPVVDGASWAASSGKKDGSVVVDGVQRLSGRAGVARPQLLHDDVVVAWFDRGASLPGELWAVPRAVKASSGTKASLTPTRLLPPKAKTAVVVYGVRP